MLEKDSKTAINQVIIFQNVGRRAK